MALEPGNEARTLRPPGSVGRPFGDVTLRGRTNALARVAVGPTLILH